MTHDELRDLCPAHALGALDGPERAALEAHLAECPDCRRRVAEDSEASAAIGATLAPEPPAPALRRRILDAVAARTGPGPAVAERGGRWSVTFATAAGLLLGIAIGIGVPGKSGERVGQLERDIRGLTSKIEASETLLAELRKNTSAEATFMANASMERMHGGVGAEAARAAVFFHDNEFHVMAAGLPAPPQGMEYQLWAVVGEKKVSLGCYTPDAAGAMVGVHRLAGDAVKSAAFAVTVEPIGGKEQPTGGMILVPAK